MFWCTRAARALTRLSQHRCCACVGHPRTRTNVNPSEPGRMV